MTRIEVLRGLFRKLFALESELKMNDVVLCRAQTRVKQLEKIVRELDEALEILLGGRSTESPPEKEGDRE